MDINVRQSSYQLPAIFNELKTALQLSCSARDDSQFRLFLSNNGFTEENTTNGFTFSMRYSLTHENGSIVINYRSYDPSGPFQNLPDENKYDATLTLNGQPVESFATSFTDQT